MIDVVMDAVNDAIDEAEIALSIDLDVFAAAFAPGVSAPNAMGIAPDAAFRRVLRGLIASERVRGVEIAELCPSLDIDDRTARLGAAIVFEIASTLGDGDEDGDQDDVEGGDDAESEFRDDDAMGSDGDR
jgi:arginase family enzyme